MSRKDIRLAGMLRKQTVKASRDFSVGNRRVPPVCFPFNSVIFESYPFEPGTVVGGETGTVKGLRLSQVVSLGLKICPVGHMDTG